MSQVHNVTHVPVHSPSERTWHLRYKTDLGHALQRSGIRERQRDGIAIAKKGREVHRQKALRLSDAFPLSTLLCVREDMGDADSTHLWRLPELHG
jgi:hypothetical protein